MPERKFGNDKNNLDAHTYNESDTLPETELMPNIERPSNTEIEEKLLSILQEFKQALLERGLNPLVWFIFGSFIKGSFRKDSDIDIGFVLNEEDSRVYDKIPLYETFDMVRVRIAGHKINITSFDTPWLARRGMSPDTVKRDGTFAQIYSPIRVLNL